MSYDLSFVSHTLRVPVYDALGIPKVLAAYFNTLDVIVWLDAFFLTWLDAFFLNTLVCY